jgi:hypothetical protein
VGLVGGLFCSISEEVFVKYSVPVPIYSIKCGRKVAGC